MCLFCSLVPGQTTLRAGPRPELADVHDPRGCKKNFGQKSFRLIWDPFPTRSAARDHVTAGYLIAFFKRMSIIFPTHVTQESGRGIMNLSGTEFGDFYRKGNSVKRSGPFSELADSEHFFCAHPLPKSQLQSNLRRPT